MTRPVACLPKVAVVALFALVPFWDAAATPPDSLEVGLRPICASATHAVFFADLGTNAGSHYATQKRWGWLTVEMTQGGWRFDRAGDLVLSSVDVEGPLDSARVVSASAGGRRGLVDVIRAQGARACPPRAVPAPPFGGPFTYVMENDELFVRSGAGRAAVGQPGPGSTTFALKQDGEGRYDFEPTRRPLVCDPDASEKPCALEPAQELRVGEYTVLMFRLHRLDESSVDAVYRVPTAQLLAAKSKALDNAGLRRHKTGKFELARRYFSTAVQFDPQNHTARYNQARASSRLGDAAGAVRALGHLRKLAGLAEKVRGDADFDPIRKDPAFAAWWNGLPKAAAP